LIACIEHPQKSNGRAFARPLARSCDLRGSPNQVFAFFAFFLRLAIVLSFPLDQVSGVDVRSLAALAR
jgi:hypothetical protein